MFNFKAKSEEIVAVGEANRGDFTPEGVPLRMYNYWLRHSSSDKAEAILAGTRRENFCHFWRVVAIWAPLRWLGEKFIDVVEAKYTGVIFGILVALAIVSIAFGGGGFAGLLLLGGILVAAAVIFAALFMLVNYLEDHPKVAKVVGWGVAGIAATVALVAFLYGTGFVGLGILVAGGVIALLVRANIERLSDWVERRREAQRKRDAERRAARQREINEFYNEHGYYPHEASKYKEPSRLDKFFRGVGDFIIMAANVVRVNKWKICPLVEVGGGRVGDNPSAREAYDF